LCPVQALGEGGYWCLAAVLPAEDVGEMGTAATTTVADIANATRIFRCMGRRLLVQE
jgi:hypothetical protein